MTFTVATKRYCSQPWSSYCLMLNPKSLSTHLLLTCWAQLIGYAIKGIMPQNGNGVKMGLSPQLGQYIDNHVTTFGSWYWCHNTLQQSSCAIVTLQVWHCDECGVEAQQAHLLHFHYTKQHTYYHMLHAKGWTKIAFYKEEACRAILATECFPLMYVLYNDH